MKSRAADELAAMIRYRAFDVTRWVSRSAEVKAFEVTRQVRQSEARGDIRREFARRASKGGGYVDL